MRADKDPLLVSWRYGLGRVTAFTSDLSGRWGRDWVAWQGFPQWASQVARDAMRKVLEAKRAHGISPDGESIKVVTDLVSRDGKFLNFLKLKANIRAPNQASQEQLLQQTAPGRYEGAVQRRGARHSFRDTLRRRQRREAPMPVATVPYIAPYPKEYRELKPNLSPCSAVWRRKPAVK